MIAVEENTPPQQETQCTNHVRQLLHRRQAVKLAVSSLKAQLTELKLANVSHHRRNLQIVEALLDLANTTILETVDKDDLRLFCSTHPCDGLLEGLLATSASHKTLGLLRDALSRSTEAAAAGDHQAGTAGFALGKAFAEALLESVEGDISALCQLLDIESTPTEP
jgi:hypothetical protein